MDLHATPRAASSYPPAGPPPSIARVARRIALTSCAVLAGSTTLPAQPASADDPPPAYYEHVDVVGITPIHGIGLPIFKVPANVQVLSAEGFQMRSAVDVPMLLNRRAAGVQIGEVQGGAFQPDVVFRGFAASPLLGASEGLAIYQDGVRMNDPFGDTVQWDVLPRTAIAAIDVIPGSNPLFGLNALGGALSIRTKDGFVAPRRRVTVATGSFGRHRLEAEAGGHEGAIAYYAAGTLMREQGWRDFSPSTVRRLFGDISWRGDAHALSVSVTAASNDLTGNGAAPSALLESDRRAVFTHPDLTGNDLVLATARARRNLSASTLLEGLAYVRGGRITTFNGDLDDDDDDANDGEEDEPAGAVAGEELSAVNNTSRTRSRGAGATAQIRRTAPLLGRDNHFIAGAGMDAAGTRFEFAVETARLGPDRGTIGLGTVVEDEAVRLRSDVATASAFVTNTWSPHERVALTASARFNATRVRLRDRIGTALDGDHRFRRVNPAAGATVQVSGTLNAYGGYSESSRVPTPVELTCADPEDPCRLPNAFVSDPPLRQVVARTWEGGMRGTVDGLRWSVAAFDSTAVDDIIFVSSGTLRGEGHFENVARTRRRGLEASLEVKTAGDRLSAFAAYTRQRAAYGTDLTVTSRAHPLAMAGELRVESGDRLPGVPAHVGRFGIEGGLPGRARFGVHGRAQSSQVLRGDEANLLAPVPGFLVLDADIRIRIAGGLAAIIEAQNLVDRRYSTFGIVGDPAPLLNDTSRRFLSPGSPRSAWVGLDLQF